MAAQPVTISEHERKRAGELRAVMQSGRAALIGPDGCSHEIPPDVHAIFLQVLKPLQEGKAVSIVPYTTQLTTQEAANILGVSRQFFVRLLEANELPFHKVGTHRRVFLADLLAYKAGRDRRRKAAVEDLIEESREAGLYGKPGSAA